MNILEITGWIGATLFASGISLVLGLIFGFLVVNETNFPSANKIFDKIFSYSISIFMMSALLLGIIYSYTWISLESKFGSDKEEYINKINDTFAYLIVQRIEDKNVTIDNVVEKDSISRDLIANTCSEGFQSEGCVKLLDNKFNQVVNCTSRYTKNIDNEIKQLRGE